MKRIILLALILAMIFSVSFAEELSEKKTYEYTFSWKLDGLLRVADGTEKEITAQYSYSFDSYEEKQPLIFAGTEENPKTGFSYMCLEEIEQLPDEEVIVKLLYDGDKVYAEEPRWTTLKTVLLELEKLFTEQKSSTYQRIIRTKNKGKIDEYNPLYLSVQGTELRILYEQLAYIFIEYFVPHTVVNTNVKGTTLAKIEAMYAGNTPDFDHIYWIPNKPKERIKADQEYIREALLNVTEKEFMTVLSRLMSQFEEYTYKEKENQYYIRTVPPDKYVKKLYGLK